MYLFWSHPPKFLCIFDMVQLRQFACHCIIFMQYICNPSHHSVPLLLFLNHIIEVFEEDENGQVCMQGHLNVLFIVMNPVVPLQTSGISSLIKRKLSLLPCHIKHHPPVPEIFPLALVTFQRLSTSACTLKSSLLSVGVKIYKYIKC